ncbi:hypothetical protein BZA05DRAFT_446426 [Tricharina praecox]|uniref:uncharacterized protein n=1 Tax=Tricharina praecox TaxID=43433 RepID=UPI00221F874F|nr:uncharacterized protein BZA05DRAFT_446426 [Tricharina praecox]KAI5848900.1 hypothetical protein BZA05DRAFT_446426 [Tricharina praecox]
MPPSSYTSSYHSPPQRLSQHRRHRSSTVSSSESAYYSPPQSYYSPPQPSYHSSHSHSHSSPHHSSPHHHQHQQQQYAPAPPAERLPNCSVCDSPAKHACACELSSLIVAVEEAEAKVLSGVWDDIRRYVTTRAQSQIHADFAAVTAQRRAMARTVVQRDVDEDWRRCVQRYPEILEAQYRRVEEAVRSGRGVAEILGGGGGGRMRVVYE